MGPHADPRLVGKSADELLGIAGALLTVAEKFNQPVPPATLAPPIDRFSLDIADDDYVRGQDVKRILHQMANQPAPVDYSARQQAAGALLATLQMQRADEFKRWPQEVRAEIQKLPMEYWTLDALGTLVDIVRSRHIDELAAEKAQRLVNESHPTIRSGTGGARSGLPNTTDTLESDGIPAEWRAKATAQGITEQQVREFCQAAGISEREYYRDLMQYGKGAVIHG